MGNKKLKIEDKEYSIKKTLYRSKGGNKQQLTNKPNKHTEKKVKFYILENDGDLFWGKEQNKKRLKNAIHEYKNGQNYENIEIDIGSDNISPVKYIAFDKKKNIIVQEFCDDFKKIGEVTPDIRKRVKKLLHEWLLKSNIKEYDLSLNNIIVKETDGTLSIKLLDFDVAPDKKLKWCFNNMNRILMIKE